MTDSISGFRNSGNNVKGVSFYNHKYFKPSKLIRKFNLNRPLDSFSNMFEFIFTGIMMFITASDSVYTFTWINKLKNLVYCFQHLFNFNRK